MALSGHYERSTDMSTITTTDGTEIYYKDWGEGPAVTFSHGWPLSADAWDGQMLFLAQNGYRVVAHDGAAMAGPARPRSGNDMNGYADDLAAVIEALDLTDATLVGHSTGGGEVARYIGRHGTEPGRQGGPGLRGAADHGEDRGQPRGPADGGVRRPARGPRQGPVAVLQGPGDPFYGANRPGAEVSQGVLDQFWLWSMQSGLKNAYESIRAFSETDFTEDLKKFDVPTLVLHGEDDQIVPVKDSARKSATAHQGRAGDLLPGRAARPHRHPPGPVQRRPAGLPPELATIGTRGAGLSVRARRGQRPVGPGMCD